MVEGACLENRCTFARTGGSNPFLTAINIVNQSVRDSHTQKVHTFRRVCAFFVSFLDGLKAVLRARVRECARILRAENSLQLIPWASNANLTQFN